MTDLPQPALEAMQAQLLAMPPARAMQLRITGGSRDRLRLEAPLAANVNDKGSAFGGSLVSLMTLAAWGLVVLEIEHAGLEAEVYVADSKIRYLAPLRADLVAEAWLEDEGGWGGFLDRGFGRFSGGFLDGSFGRLRGFLFGRRLSRFSRGGGFSRRLGGGRSAASRQRQRDHQQ